MVISITYFRSNFMTLKQILARIASYLSFETMCDSCGNLPPVHASPDSHAGGYCDKCWRAEGWHLPGEPAKAAPVDPQTATSS